MALSRRPIAAAVCLPPSAYHPPAGTKCWTAGWGYNDKGQVAEKLQEVDRKRRIFNSWINVLCRVNEWR